MSSFAVITRRGFLVKKRVEGLPESVGFGGLLL
jgi:hypothetical protein